MEIAAAAADLPDRQPDTRRLSPSLHASGATVIALDPRDRSIRILSIHPREGVENNGWVGRAERRKRHVETTVVLGEQQKVIAMDRPGKRKMIPPEIVCQEGVGRKGRSSLFKITVKNRSGVGLKRFEVDHGWMEE